MAWLKRNKWALFLIQQVMVFALAVAFITSVRAITGKSIHGGEDPLGLVDGAALLLVFAGMCAATSWFYRATEGHHAPALGFALTPTRAAQFVGGTVLGFAVMAMPDILGIATGTAHVTDSIIGHIGVLEAVAIGAILFGNSFSEETTSRAYPMRLFRERSLVFRILVPSLFFAALHLADESFDPGAFYSRALAGVVFSIAYAWTDDLWLASGLHTGWNMGASWDDGTWNVGSLFEIQGTSFGPSWGTDAVWTAVAVLGWVALVRRRIR